jgi:hypothetical protein
MEQAKWFTISCFKSHVKARWLNIFSKEPLSDPTLLIAPAICFFAIES